MKSLTIATDNKQDRDALMGVLYSFGAAWHQDVSPGKYDLKAANEAYTDMLTLRLELIRDSLDICGLGNRAKTDVNWSTDTNKALDLIKGYVGYVTPVPSSIYVDNVGDYSAEVKKDGIHIYNQVIPFDKFDEIAAAVNKLNK